MGEQTLAGLYTRLPFIGASLIVLGRHCLTPPKRQALPQHRVGLARSSRSLKHQRATLQNKPLHRQALHPPVPDHDRHPRQPRGLRRQAVCRYVVLPEVFKRHRVGLFDLALLVYRILRHLRKTRLLGSR